MTIHGSASYLPGPSGKLEPKYSLVRYARGGVGAGEWCLRRIFVSSESAGAMEAHWYRLSSPSQAVVRALEVTSDIEAHGLEYEVGGSFRFLAPSLSAVALRVEEKEGVLVKLYQEEWRFEDESLPHACVWDSRFGCWRDYVGGVEYGILSSEIRRPGLAVYYKGWDVEEAQ